MSFRDLEQLQLLIQTFSDDLVFYQSAASTAERPEHQAIFGRMAKARSFALDYLKPFAQSGHGDGVHAFGSLLHKMYPEILAGLDPAYDLALIEQSALVEARTLAAMRKALANMDSPLIKSVLKDLCPLVNGDHHVSCWEKAS